MLTTCSPARRHLALSVQARMLLSSTASMLPAVVVVTHFNTSLNSHVPLVKSWEEEKAGKKKRKKSVPDSVPFPL